MSKGQDNSTTASSSLERAVPHEALSNPTYPELKSCSRYIRRAGWEKRAPPVELARFPDEFTISEQLQRIIQWSLMPGNNWYSAPEVNISVEQDVASVHEARQQATEASGPVHEHPSNSIRPQINIRQHANTITPTTPAEDRLDVVSIVSSSNSNERQAWRSRMMSKLLLRKQSQRLASIPLLRADEPAPALAECISCFEEFPEPDLTRLQACRHFYCKECLTMLITTAMASEASFPPKCCLSPVPLHTVLVHLSEAQREEYKTKSAEYAVPPGERVYCPNTKCASWIPPTRLKVVRQANYQCPHCSEEFCRICRGPVHAANTECPQDFNLEATLNTADLEGWQRCYSCRALVEHATGCRHMTCRCRAEFCYVCGARWSTCHCTENDAQRKRQDVARRREERVAAANAEAEEIARAIAEVEEMERREAEERRLAEEKAKREEEEILAALEVERQLEEAERQAAADQAEKEWLGALQASFDHDFDRMTDEMEKINRFQMAVMNSRHEVEEATIAASVGSRKIQMQSELDTVLEKVTSRYEALKEELRKQHKQEAHTLAAEQETEEDDMFISIQVRLRGKANKESRMERMMDELLKAQEEARTEMLQVQEKATRLLGLREEVDVKGLIKYQETELERLEGVHATELQKLGYLIGADRHYFELVFQRRRAMVQKHGEIARGELANSIDPVGLREWHAAGCLPFLPEQDNDDIPGPSGVPRENIDWEMERTEPHVPESDDFYSGADKSSQEDLSVPGSFPRDTKRRNKTMPPVPNARPPSPPSLTVSLASALKNTQPSPRAQAMSPIAVETSPSRSSASKSPRPESSISNDTGRSSSSQALSPTWSPEVRTHERRGSEFASEKRIKWFGRKSKEMSPDEFRQRMRLTVGDAM